MHELGITRNIVAIVADNAGGKKVKRVAIDIGKLAGVMADAIRFSFDVVSAGTCVEGAVLEIREIAGRARCRDCSAEFSTPTLVTPCPCGSRRIERLSGEELKVREFEFERPAQHAASDALAISSPQP